MSPTPHGCPTLALATLFFVAILTALSVVPGTAGEGGEVPRSLGEPLNEAAGLARDGKHREAVAILDRLVPAVTTASTAAQLPALFRWMVVSNRAYSLMDLGQHREAVAALSAPPVVALMGKLGPEERFARWLALGNAQGNLGAIDPAKTALLQAVGVGLHQLHDPDRCREAFVWILHWGKEHKKWEWLEKACLAAHQFGVEQSNYALQAQAGEFAFYSLRGQGNNEAARKRAGRIIEFYREAGAASETAHWQSLHDQLPPP